MIQIFFMFEKNLNIEEVEEILNKAETLIDIVDLSSEIILKKHSEKGVFILKGEAK